MYKMTKFVKNCIFLRNRLIQVIHIKNTKKGGKIVVFQKFSTLSTMKHVFFVDYLKVENERMFCEHVMKMSFCRKKTEIMLTSEKLKYTNKLCQIVYTMIKRGYNKDTDEKRR